MLKRKEKKVLEDIARERTPVKERYGVDDREFCRILKKLSEHNYIQGIDFVIVDNESAVPVFLDLDVTLRGQDALGFFE
jgi:hypothetical protein